MTRANNPCKMLKMSIFPLVLSLLLSCISTALIEDKNVYPGYLSYEFIEIAEKYIADHRYANKNDTVFKRLRERVSLTESSSCRLYFELTDDVPLPCFVSDDINVYPGYLSSAFIKTAEKYIADHLYTNKKDTRLRERESATESLTAGSLTESIPSTSLIGRGFNSVSDDFIYVPRACKGFIRKWDLFYGNVESIGKLIGWASRLGFIENIIRELKLPKYKTSYVILPQNNWSLIDIKTYLSNSFTFSSKFYVRKLFLFLFGLSKEFERHKFYKNILAIQLDFEPCGDIGFIRVILLSYNIHDKNFFESFFEIW